MPATQSAPLRATIVVTTKDRREDLRRCLLSVLAQSADCDVLVLDDGSRDGTGPMVAEEFPSVALDRSEQSRGLIAQRNRAAQLVRTPLIVSIDDDAELTSPDTVAQTIAEFDNPRVGVVAMPFIDVRHGPDVRQRAPEGDRLFVADAYVGTAHALRRSVFQALGGYREHFVRQHEEVDYSLRMLDAGFVVRQGRADPLLHFESPVRDSETAFINERRNLMLHAWHNVPMPYLPVRLAKVTLHTVSLARRHGHGRLRARGVLLGWRDGLRCRSQRNPVTRATYRIDHELRKRGPLPLDEIEHRLPALRVTTTDLGSELPGSRALVT